MGDLEEWHGWRGREVEKESVEKREADEKEEKLEWGQEVRGRKGWVKVESIEEELCESGGEVDEAQSEK